MQSVTSAQADTLPWSADGMKERRDTLYQKIRQSFRRFVDQDGNWLCPPAAYEKPDPRILVQVSLPYLLGDENDRQLARKLIYNPHVQARINHCAFTTEYLLAVLYSAGELMPEDIRNDLQAKIAEGLLVYATKDLQHHGYNDNHVTLATASLILGGQLTNNRQATEEGRANLLNFRDTFLRRGFMHEVNDCYIPHTLYPLACIAEFSTDQELRELAEKCEARVWLDWLGHWHPELARKAGPSARDYTNGRLHPKHMAVALWGIFGDGFSQPVYQADDIFKDNEVPAQRYWRFNSDPDDATWNTGFIARMLAHPYHIPAEIAKLAYRHSYPFEICGTHETGSATEACVTSYYDVACHVTLNKSTPLLDVMPHAGREQFTYQYQEEDWVMGTASQRMIGGCPNNNWELAYRKSAPLTCTADQGMMFCSYTINEKSMAGRHTFAMQCDNPTATVREGTQSWFDNGRYAGMQHQRTTILLYRPRIHEMHKIRSLATTLVFPLCFHNQYDHIWFGETEISDFSGESIELRNIYVQDGPLFIGIRPLLSRPQSCRVRLRAEKVSTWGLIHIYAYDGEPTGLHESDLCRIGGGFLCEVAPVSEFKTIAAFRNWFEQSQVLDDQLGVMRQVRYRREGLTMGIRYDALADTILYRMLNGRTMPLPYFHCTDIDNAQIPWMEEDVTQWDHFSWAARQAGREYAPQWPENGVVTKPFAI